MIVSTNLIKKTIVKNWERVLKSKIYYRLSWLSFWAMVSNRFNFRLKYALLFYTHFLLVAKFHLFFRYKYFQFAINSEGKRRISMRHRVRKSSNSNLVFWQTWWTAHIYVIHQSYVVNVQLLEHLIRCSSSTESICTTIPYMMLQSLRYSRWWILMSPIGSKSKD